MQKLKMLLFIPCILWLVIFFLSYTILHGSWLLVLWYFQKCYCFVNDQIPNTPRRLIWLCFQAKTFYKASLAPILSFKYLIGKNIIINRNTFLENNKEQPHNEKWILAKRLLFMPSVKLSKIGLLKWQYKK